MGPARRRAISGGALIVFGGGLALYQMTSLVLGPVKESRQLHLSVSMPVVDRDDLPQPVVDNVNVVLGTLASPSISPSLTAAGHAAINMALASGPAPATMSKVEAPGPHPTAAAAHTPQPTYHDADERSLRLARRR